MDDNKTPAGYLRLGAIMGWAIFVTGIAYAVTTVAGFTSLVSPGEPFGQPYITIMELLILLIAPLMVVSLACLHYYTGAKQRVYTIVATGCILVTTAITSCVHFSILILANSTLPAYRASFAFKWPSVVYVLDILAWDWFFALSMFFAAIPLRGPGLEKATRWLMTTSGLLSLVGLCGVPAGNMQVRNIGIIGYALLGPVVFLLIGLLCRNRLRKLPSIPS